MIPILENTNIIREYPFRLGNLVIDALGKPYNWKEVLSNLHNAKMYELLANHVFDLGELGEKRIVCPSPVHKTDITSSKNLRVFSIAPNQVAIYRGTDADGAEVLPGEVYALASGDCPTVTVHDPITGATVACHFNRENGIDQDILQSVLNYFSLDSRGRLIAVISLGIGPENFRHEWDHPTHGTNNKKRSLLVITEFGSKALLPPARSGKLNLRYIASKRLVQGGLRASNIYLDEIDTFSDSRFWSHRASQHIGNEKHSEGGRNLVLVANLRQT